MPLSDIPPGTIVHSVELIEGNGGKLARSAGASVTLSGLDGDYAIIKLSSGESRKVRASCKATIGSVSNLILFVPQLFFLSARYLSFQHICIFSYRF